MDMNPDPLIAGGEIAVILLAVLVCALASAADKAIDLANRNQIRQLAEEGDVRAGRLLVIYERPSNYTTAVRITMIVLFFLGGMLFYKETTLRLLGERLTEGSYGFFLLSVFLTACVFCLLAAVLAILVPRQIGMKQPEKTALALSGYALLLSRLLRPFVVLNRGLAHGILKLLRQEGYEEEEPFSEDEVMSLLEVGQETGLIKEEGKKMIDSIFAFDDKLAYEIMTPRTDVFSIDIDDDPSVYLDDLMQLQYSRIPLYEEDSDNIVGILNIKDFLIKARDVGFENVDLREIMREAFFVPETKNIDSLFFELQKMKNHIAILIDEYGGFSGIVTLEDIIEEVMGEINDEFDEEEPKITVINDHTYRMDGNMDLDDINEETGSDLTSENSETIGGLLIDLLGEIPADGEVREITEGRYKFTIESIRDRRVETVLMEIGE